MTYYKNDLNMEKYGFLNLSLGILSGIITIITGFITDWDMGYMENPFPVFSTLGSLMIVCIIFYCILFYLLS